MTAIDPRWLTSTVCDLTDAVRDERDAFRLPILADALMDAGCDDEELTNYLRRQDREWIEYLDWFLGYWQTKYERQAAADDVLNWMSRWSRDGIDRAIEQMKSMAAAIGGPGYYDDESLMQEPMSFAELMNAAAEYVRTGEYRYMGANMNYQDFFWPEKNSEEFWNNYELLTGETVSQRESFFRCAC
jgi:hypothetical protein